MMNGNSRKPTTSNDGAHRPLGATQEPDHDDDQGGRRGRGRRSRRRAEHPVERADLPEPQLGRQTVGEEPPRRGPGSSRSRWNVSAVCSDCSRGDWTLTQSHGRAVTTTAPPATSRPRHGGTTTRPDDPAAAGAPPPPAPRSRTMLGLVHHPRPSVAPSPAHSASHQRRRARSRSRGAEAERQQHGGEAERDRRRVEEHLAGAVPDDGRRPHPGEQAGHPARCPRSSPGDRTATPARR